MFKKPLVWLLFFVLLFVGSTVSGQEEAISPPVVAQIHDTGDWHVIDAIRLGEKSCFVVVGTNSIVTRCFDTFEPIVISETIPLPDNDVRAYRFITRVQVGSKIECLVVTSRYENEYKNDISYSCSNDIKTSS